MNGPKGKMPSKRLLQNLRKKFLVVVMELKLKKEKEKNAVEAAEDEVVIITELPMVMKGQKNLHQIIKVQTKSFYISPMGQYRFVF